MLRLLADLKHALRVFRTSPGFAAMVVAAIALGIGTNTAIFSVVNAVVLKPVPFAEPDRIVQLQVKRDEVDFGWNTSSAKFNVWREIPDVFSDIAGFMTGVPLNLTEGDTPEQISAARVTEGYFRVFGAPIARGRTFTPDEDLPNSAATVVLSHAFWTNRLAADPDIVGKSRVVRRRSAHRDRHRRRRLRHARARRPRSLALVCGSTPPRRTRRITSGPWRGSLPA